MLELAKYTLFVLIGYMVYLTYEFVVKPFMYRKMYQRYPNVKMTEKFIPVLGDAAIAIQNVRSNRYMMWGHIKNGLENPDCDIKFVTRGSEIRYFMTSPEAIKQFIDLIPAKIDRNPISNRYLSRLVPAGLGSTPLTEN